jgi:hypothetical protein
MGAEQWTSVVREYKEACDVQALGNEDCHVRKTCQWLLACIIMTCTLL